MIFISINIIWKLKIEMKVLNRTKHSGKKTTKANEEIITHLNKPSKHYTKMCFSSLWVLSEFAHFYHGETNPPPQWTWTSCYKQWICPLVLERNKIIFKWNTNLPNHFIC